jgi:hypothetical protein
MKSRIMSWALAFAAVNALAGCGPATSTAAPTISPGTSVATVSPDARALLSRPVKLPALAAGAACPVTPLATASVGIENPRGRGPFYLGGPLPKGAYPFNKMVYVVAGGGSGPVVLRGGRLDGAGRLTFSGIRADPAEQGEMLSASGESWAFYQAIIGGTEDALYLYPSTNGCYAVQIDGVTFQDVITITAS